MGMPVTFINWNGPRFVPRRRLAAVSMGGGVGQSLFRDPRGLVQVGNEETVHAEPGRVLHADRDLPQLIAEIHKVVQGAR